MVKYFKNISNSVLSILEGMTVTLSWMFRRPYTVQWPDKIEKHIEDTLPERYRGILEVETRLCIACLACMKECPIEVIAITVERNAETKERRITQFDIDASKCMACGLCVEACPTGGDPAHDPVCRRRSETFATSCCGTSRRARRSRLTRRRGLRPRSGRREASSRPRSRTVFRCARPASWIGEAMTYAIMFYALCALILVSSATVALSTNIIYSAFSLLFAFIGVGLIYAMLSADFLAITQLMLYVGGILVLILFAVMLTFQIEESKRSNQSFSRGLALLMAAGLFCVLAIGGRARSLEAACRRAALRSHDRGDRKQPPGTVSVAF